MMGYKPELEKSEEESSITKLLQRKKKLRVNNEFPIILNEIFYPSNLKSSLQLSLKA
jgi:hypothetical protein